MGEKLFRRITEVPLQSQMKKGIIFFFKSMNVIMKYYFFLKTKLYINYMIIKIALANQFEKYRSKTFRGTCFKEY